MTKIYLASPFFKEEEIVIYDKVIETLRKQGFEVFVPREHEVLNAWDMPNYEWAKEVFEIDCQGIRESDIVIVLNFGMYSDSGTAWECGYAFAREKTTVVVLCGEKDVEYSLMMINGAHWVLTLEQLLNEPLVPLTNKKVAKENIMQK